MTNILATVAMIVTTNWVTISTTRPVCDRPGCLVIHYDTENQVGARVTNTVATIVWKGKTNEVILESTEAFFHGDLKRETFKPTIPLYPFTR